MIAETNRYTEPVLLVDDEEDIRDVLEMSLADMGYTVYPAANGEEALELYRRHSPPIVMTDIKMPGIDGIELLKRIKRENPDTEVVMITGHGDMDLAVESLKYEATDFITKPINVDALELALKRVAKRVLMKQQLKEYTLNLERLIYEKTQLQDHLASLGLMIGSISHGIKGLLTGLDGGLYVLDSGLAKSDSERIREGMDLVKGMVGQIRKLVLDILFYAKERDLKREPIDLCTFAGKVAQIMKPRLEQHQIEFVTDFDPNLEAAPLDADLLQTALVNILENAVDACIRDSSKSKHDVTFRVGEDVDSLFFEVSDNGIGMDHTTLENIFTLFFSSKGNKGTGFGLFIAHHIVKQHGGSIAVKSKPGQGACFTVRIPGVLQNSSG